MQAQSRSGSEPDRADLVARVEEIEARLQATAAAVDEKGLKEFRRTLEALAKRDPKFEERVTNKVDVIADRLETFARTVSNTSAALAAKDGEIAQLRRSVEAGSARVESALAETRRGQDPAGLAQIKRELADLSKQRLPRGIEGRMDELGAKLTMLAQRIDSVSSTVSTTASALAGREGDVTALRRAYEVDTDRIDAELQELRRGCDPSTIVELREAVSELRAQSTGHGRSIQRVVEEANATLKTLFGRLESLSTSAAATAKQVSGGEEALAALRVEVEEVGSGLGTQLTELRKTVASLSAQTVALEQAESESARNVEGRFSTIGARVDELTGRFETLGSIVSATRERLGERDLELETIETRFHDASSRVDGLVGELSRALAEFPDPRALEQQLQERVDGLAGRIEGLSGQITQTETTVSRELERAASASEELERRLGDERGQVAGLTGRLDSLEASIASTAARLTGGEEELAALGTLVEERGAQLSSQIGDLGQAVSVLSAQTAALERGDDEAVRSIDERVSRIGEQLDDVAGRLESLTASLASTTTRVSGSEDALSALRTYVEDGGSQLSSSLAELRQAFVTLTAQAAALERADGETARTVDERISTFDGRIEELVGRVDSLSTSVASTETRARSSDEELSAVREYVEQGASRLGAHIGELQKSVALLSSQAAALEQTDVRTERVLEERVGPLAKIVAELTGRLDSVAQRADDEVERRLDELVTRLDSADEDRTARSGEIARLAAILEVERASVRTRIEELVASQESSNGTLVADELERLSGRFDVERASFQAQLEAITKALSWSSPQSAVEARIDDLAERLAEVERNGAAVASKVSHASTLVPTALRSLEARLEEVAPVARIVEPSVDPPAHSLPPEPEYLEVPDEDEVPDREATPVIQLRGADP